MKLSVKTKILQDMTTKANRGASNNKMIPITSLLSIQWMDGELILTTTDASNTLKIKNKMDGEKFEIVVQADLFNKLISKITTEDIVLTIQKNNLEIKGNGVYNIELPLDEEGNPIKFPTTKKIGDAQELSIKRADLNKILSTNKAALAATMEIPVLSGYYFGEQVISTDSFKVCSNEINLLDKDILLPSSMIDLLDLFTEDEIKAKYADGQLLFYSNNIELSGHEFPGIEDYPYEAIKAFLGAEFDKSCHISRNKLFNILDRLNLFVTEYDQNGIYLTFSNDGIWIKSKKSNGVEKLPYLKEGEFEGEDYTIFIDIELFSSQLAAQTSDEVELFYGHEKAIKMISGGTTQVIALLADEGEI